MYELISVESLEFFVIINLRDQWLARPSHRFFFSPSPNNASNRHSLCRFRIHCLFFFPPLFSSFSLCACLPLSFIQLYDWVEWTRSGVSQIVILTEIRAYGCSYIVLCNLSMLTNPEYFSWIDPTLIHLLFPVCDKMSDSMIIIIFFIQYRFKRL